MERSARYSVIIPHYNDEVGLKKLLASIPPRDDVQVLVIDDRSDTLASRQIVDDSKLPNALWLSNDRVKSAGACRNIGLENATGKYLLFADSDDVFDKKAFFVFDQKSISSYEIDLFFFRVFSACENGNKAARHLVINKSVDEYIRNRNEESACRLRLAHHVPWGKMIKADLVYKNHIKFDETIVSNDGIFSLKVGKAARNISVHDDVVYHSIIRRVGLSSSKNKDNYRVRLEVYVKYFNMLNKNERNLLNASPIPLLYKGVGYGLVEFVRSVIYLKRNKVYIFKHYRIKLGHIKILMFGR